MRILGIDPGLNTTGYGVLDFAAGQPRLIEAGVVRGNSRCTLAERVQEIHNGVADVIATLKPEVLAIEELYSHYERPTTAILMGHARGVILLAAAEASIPVESYASTLIKKTITGNGHAAKWQMQEAIRRELDLPQIPEPPDVADALAIALCRCYLSRVPAGVGEHPSRKSGIRNPQSEIQNPP
ncbi:MAG TPA: crossover junction endodeoxyribonuclease RuvC [Lacipirellulaceae bacterium]